jgi:hypothetical protein
MITIRPATRADIERFYGSVRPGPTMRAIALLRDGEPVGLAGLAQQGFALLAFTELREDVPLDKVMPALIAGLVELKRWIKNARTPVVAIGRSGESEARLIRFGFEPIGEVEQGKVFRWPN